MTNLKSIIPLRTRVSLRRTYSRWAWPRSGHASPAPQHVKLGVLKRYGYLDGIWIESGTFLGDTTRFLARTASMVYTIEPSTSLAARADARFRNRSNVKVLTGLSEAVLPSLLPEIVGTVSFWLDGHTSGGPTHLGPQVTPIREELGAIEAHLSRFENTAIFVDDIRGFTPNSSYVGPYPPRSFLVEWADRNHLNWTIEHDIFGAWN